MRRIRGRALSSLTGGTAIVLGSMVLTNLLRIGSSATLTRILDAGAFGVVGIITSITVIIGLISDIGVVPFVVRHEHGNDRRFLDEVWTARLVRSILITAITAASSGMLATYAGKPELQPVLAVWSLILLFEGMTSMAFATSIREQNLKHLSLFELGINLFQIFTSVVLAYVFRSYWALVAAVIIASATKAVLSYLLFPNASRRIAWSNKRLAEIWKFSRYITSSSILTLLISQSDKIVFARVMSLPAFGLYAIATTLATAPLPIINPYADRILYPAYARAFRETPARLRAIYYSQRRLVTFLFCFAMGGFIGSAPLLVHLLYDPRYSSVASIMQILAITPMLALPNWAADRVLLAKGKAWSSLAGNVSRLGWLAAGGLAAWLMHSSFLFIVVVGTMEIPATLFHWAALKYYELLDLREEFAGLALSGVGFVIGTAGSHLILAWMAG